MLMRVLACRSYPVTLFMNVPWVVLHFPLYETSKQLMAPQHHGMEGPAVQIAAGGLAGGVAAALVSYCSHLWSEPEALSVIGVLGQFEVQVVFSA